MLEKLYLKISKGGNLDLSDILEFIRESARIFKPDYPYDESKTLFAFQTGLGNEVLRGVLSAIESNPDLVKFQITKVYDNSGNLLKTITKKLN